MADLMPPVNHRAKQKFPKVDAVTAPTLSNSSTALKAAWELGVIPIPKSVTRSRVEQNIQIFDFELTTEEKEKMRAFDRGYRTIDVKWWRDSPHYPFEKH